MDTGFLYLCGNCKHLLSSQRRCGISAVLFPIDETTDASECVRKGNYTSRD